MFGGISCCFLLRRFKKRINQARRTDTINAISRITPQLSPAAVSIGLVVVLSWGVVVVLVLSLVVPLPDVSVAVVPSVDGVVVAELEVLEPLCEDPVLPPV